MVRFYDPIDRGDQARVEQLLRAGGIEYSLQDEPDVALAASQILVAEEDIPRAEKILSRSLH